MAKKSTTKKIEVGNYVRVNKTTIGVVVGRSPFEEDVVYVASVDRDGDTNHNTYVTRRLTKIAAPQYVVVWSDEYSDPFCQFETKAEADKFAAGLRKKTRSIVEVRVYKLTK